MINYETEARALHEILSKDSTAIANLARLLNRPADDIFAELERNYDEQLEANTMEYDDDGLYFRTPYAEITLYECPDKSSAYDYSMRYYLLEAEPIPEADSEVRLPESLDNAFFAEDNMYRLNYYATGRESYPSDALIDQLKLDYLNALERNEFVHYESSYNFRLSIHTPRGETLKAGIKPSRENPNRWVVNHVGKARLGEFPVIFTPIYDARASVQEPAAEPVLTVELDPQVEIDPSIAEASEGNSELSSFARLRSGYLEEVASFVREEKWTFNGGESLDVLADYLNYTFVRIRSEGKLCISERFNESDDFAAFNTGLADRSDGSDVYMCFTRESGRWQYAGVCTECSGTMWLRLVNRFNPLPERASYITTKEDVIFDTSKKIVINYEHILLDNLARLPMSFVRSALNDADLTPAVRNDALVRLNRIEHSQKLSDIEGLAQLATKHRNFYASLLRRFKSVVSQTIARLERNFHLAVTGYYVRGEEFNVLLPLRFDGVSVQAALVVNRSDSGIYIARTILTLEQSYRNARLVSELEGTWLGEAV